MVQGVGPVPSRPLYQRHPARPQHDRLRPNPSRQPGPGPRVRPQRRRIRQGPGDHGPHADPHRARRVQRHVVGALQLQVVPRLAAPASDQAPLGDPWPRGECRRGGHRRRAGRRVQDGIAQPSQLHRAVPGRRHRRRRHPARRVHHGRAADRQPERAAVRLARPSAHQGDRRWCGARHRRLRQLRRRPHGRGRGQFSPRL